MSKPVLRSKTDDLILALSKIRQGMVFYQGRHYFAGGLTDHYQYRVQNNLRTDLLEMGVFVPCGILIDRSAVPVALENLLRRHQGYLPAKAYVFEVDLTRLDELDRSLHSLLRARV